MSSPLLAGRVVPVAGVARKQCAGSRGDRPGTIGAMASRPKHQPPATKPARGARRAAIDQVGRRRAMHSPSGSWSTSKRRWQPDVRMAGQAARDKAREQMTIGPPLLPAGTRDALGAARMISELVRRSLP